MTEEDKYFRTIDTGGYSPCILGNNAIIPRGEPRNVLPNCVGLATGLFNEMGGYGYCKYLGNTNANNFINLAREQGLEIGMTPKVGACMVWDDGNCGHVAIVKEVRGPYDCLTVHSGWNAGMYEWECSQYADIDGSWMAGNPDEPYNNLGWLNKTNGYRFLGFIYNPALEVDKTLPNPVEENKQVDQIQVHCDDTMNVRLKPTTNSESIGFAKKGFYNIIKQDEDEVENLKWFEVEKNKWIALVSPIVDYIPKIQETPQNEPKGEDGPIIPEEPKIPENGQKEEKTEHNDNIFIKIIKFIIELIQKIFKKEN